MTGHGKTESYEYVSSLSLHQHWHRHLTHSASYHQGIHLSSVVVCQWAEGVSVCVLWHNIVSQFTHTIHNKMLWSERWGRGTLKGSVVWY